MDSITLRVAAKAVIQNEKGEILFLREADTYEEGTNLGKYTIPGGRLNLGESYEEGLHREVFEETGLTVEPLYPVHVAEWRPVIKGEQYQIVAIFTLCKALPGDIKLSEEHDDYKWIDPKNVPEDVVLTVPEIEMLDNLKLRERN